MIADADLRTEFEAIVDELTRRGLLLGGAGAVVLGLGACGSDGGSPAVVTTEAVTGFPVLIEHRFGTTTIPAPPKRVVTVGLTEQDAVLALGVVPVATTKWLEAYPGEIGPWAAAGLGSATAPEVLDPADGVQFERLAALSPDLIVALYSDVDEQTYAKLAALAPTVVPPSGVPDFGIAWEQATLIVGEALGRSAQAQQLVDGVTSAFTAVREAHPELAGRTVAAVTPYDGYFVFGRNDPRTQLLQRIGLSFPAELDDFVGEEYGKSLSEELADRLDLDALLWLLDDLAGDTKKLHAGVYGRLPVVTEGREILVDDTTDYGHAISFVSVLSLPYVLERLVPQLVAALDGDPATTIPTA